MDNCRFTTEENIALATLTIALFDVLINVKICCPLIICTKGRVAIQNVDENSASDLVKSQLIVAVVAVVPPKTGGGAQPVFV